MQAITGRHVSEKTTDRVAHLRKELIEEERLLEEVKKKDAELKKSHPEYVNDDCDDGFEKVG